MSKEFKGIWIPKEIVSLKDIGSTQKMILSTIIALDNDKGCTANNRYFAEMFDISRTRVSLILKELSDKKYVTLLTKVKTYNTDNNIVDTTIDISYPFDGLEFINQWQRWLKYKKDEHRFTYKTDDSHQTGLDKLKKDSGGIESVAIEMINSSIANGYKGLFKPKSNQQHGQSITEAHQRVHDTLENAKLSLGNDQLP